MRTAGLLAIAAAAIACRDPEPAARPIELALPAAGPSFGVPGSVGRLTTAVGDSAPATLAITNTGDQPLMITVALDGTTSAAAWRALACTTRACPLPAGDTLALELAFEPTVHGELDATLEVFGPPASGSQTVALLGTGVGGKLRVDAPPPPGFVLDFGTIAKNQLVALPLELSNIGNAPLEVTPSSPTAPFSWPVTPLVIDDGTQQQLAISCMSATALPPRSETITLTTDAYAQNTPSIEVRCAVANTAVQLTSPLDFGELRVGAAAGVLEVEIANPVGSPAVTIGRIALTGAQGFPALALTAPAVPAMLAPGAQLTATLELATGADVELANVALEVDVTETDTVTLSQPVTGKVGTPAAVVLPASLDLGSVCIGTSVDGEVTLTNTGTATLTLQRPTLSDDSFVAVFANPTDYPDTGAQVVPGDKATVGVVLAAGDPGLQESVLTWNVDVPNAPFETRVSVALLQEGTAVSPAALRFGGVDIATPPVASQTITLENCGPAPALVSYTRVDAAEGSASAWKLNPPLQQRELQPDETMRVRVAFDPDRPGHHLAYLPFTIDDGEQLVELEGDATGTLPEETSFYACGCSGSSDPARGWPILLAGLLVLRRRTR